MERCSSIELIPFLALAIGQMAVIHLSIPIGESSQIEPTFGANCFRHALRFQMRRLGGVVVFLGFAAGANEAIRPTERRQIPWWVCLNITKGCALEILRRGYRRIPTPLCGLAALRESVSLSVEIRSDRHPGQHRNRMSRKGATLAKNSSWPAIAMGCAESVTCYKLWSGDENLRDEFSDLAVLETKKQSSIGLFLAAPSVLAGRLPP